MMKFFILIFLTNTITIFATRDPNNLLDDTYFLPNSVKPTRYNLTLEPFIRTKNGSYFIGSISIDIQVFENIDCIKLHSKNLKIDENSLKILDSRQESLNILNTSFDEVREFFIINLEAELEKDFNYQIVIPSFSGSLLQKNLGFYLGNYYTSKNERKYFAVTDFEPSDARRAFPCFDAPNMKATFIINIIRTGDYISISNEQLERTQNLENNRFIDTFKETVIMPTYVVAFAIVDFKQTPQIERHRVFANKEAIDSGQLDYALSEGVTLLKLMEDFTGVNYKLSKMDLLAIPHKYFQEEAMENWGLVTFSETHLFMSNETSKTQDYERCTTYIAHEFSHQWFGNLVSFKEWQYTWLSEGFAAFFQYYLTSLAKPSWRTMELLVVTIVHNTLILDTYNTEAMNTRPTVIGKIPNPVICYYKSSAVIRMHQHILTEPIFQRALHIYIERNKFKSVTPLHLYQAYQDAIEENNVNELVGNYNVSTILSSWDSNAGFPIITVTRNYETGTVTINQTRYFENPNDIDKSNSIWYVPINYVYQSDKNYNFTDTSTNLWLTNRSITLQHNVLDGWLLINKQQTGYYRVNYDLTNWNRLAAYLNTEDYEKIHPLNRAHLINEAFHLATNYHIPYNVFFNISKYLVREKDTIPIIPFLSSILELHNLLRTSKVNDMFQTFVISSLETSYNSMGFEETSRDTHLNKIQRPNIVNLLCKYGHHDATSRALEIIKNWKKNGNVLLSPNMEATILCCGMKFASLEEWEFLYNITQTLSTNKKESYYNALQCSSNEEVLRRMFEVHFAPTLTYFRRIFTPHLSFPRFLAIHEALEITVEYVGNSNIDNIPTKSLLDIVRRIESKELFDKMNLQNRTVPFVYKKLEATVEENINRINTKSITEIENWFMEFNSI